MPHTSLRVGLVGAGANTRIKHIPGLRALSGVEITAVCNRRPESTAAAARVRCAAHLRALAGPRRRPGHRRRRDRRLAVHPLPRHAGGPGGGQARPDRGPHGLQRGRGPAHAGRVPPPSETRRADRAQSLRPQGRCRDARPHRLRLARRAARGAWSTASTGRLADPAAPLSWRQDARAVRRQHAHTRHPARNPDALGAAAGARAGPGPRLHPRPHRPRQRRPPGRRDARQRAGAGRAGRRRPRRLPVQRRDAVRPGHGRLAVRVRRRPPLRHRGGPHHRRRPGATGRRQGGCRI